MDEGRKGMAKVIARAWSDESYRKQLHSKPRETLAEAGLHVPENHKIKVVEDTADTTHVVIPAKPEHLKGEQLSSGQIHPDICKIFC